MIPLEIRKLLKEVFKFRGRVTSALIAGALMGVADTVNANLLKSVFDGLQFGKVHEIKIAFYWILSLSFLKAVSRYIHLFNMNYIAELVTQSLRQQMQSKFMSLNLSFYNNYLQGSGGLISRTLNDLILIRDGIQRFADFLREPILFVGLIGTLFYLNWKLTATLLLVLPFVIAFLKVLSVRVKKYSLKAQEGIEQLTLTIKETLDGVRIIQSFNLEEEMKLRFQKESESFLHSRKRIYSLIEASGPVTEYVVVLVVFSIIIYMTLEISSGRSTYGDFMSYLAALMMMGAPIKRLQESFMKNQETTVAAKRIFALLEESSEVPQVQSGSPFPLHWNEIIFDNISFKYKDHNVINQISLRVKKGEMVALVGESGSGKSTLVNLLLRFFEPSQGVILFDHIPISEMDLKDLRRHIALVTQDVFLFSDTIEKNIWSGNFSKSNYEVVSCAQKANAHAFISKLDRNYHSRVGERGNLLSGGEKQRISIARAIFKDAPVLILDEATSALDSASEIEVQKGLDSLMKGRTSFVIAHRLSTVMKADRIIVLKNGFIVEVGTHNELLEKKGDYFQFYSLSKI